MGVSKELASRYTLANDFGKGVQDACTAQELPAMAYKRATRQVPVDPPSVKSEDHV
jgi:hypothetical protein